MALNLNINKPEGWLDIPKQWLDAAKTLPNLTLADHALNIAVFFTMFGGVIPYFPQYLEIQRKQTVKGFSSYVCLTTIVANIVRVFFWYGKRFETPLLVQSFVMVLVMLTMMHLCTKVKRKTEQQGVVKKFSDFDPQHFWKWTYFSSYLQFIVVITCCGCLLTYLFGNFIIYTEALGCLALCLEATLGIPQLIRNFQNRSTYGMSLSMVMLWLLSDVGKSVYFVIRKSPIQFWLLGFAQVATDIAIILQVLVYGRKQRQHQP